MRVEVGNMGLRNNMVELAVNNEASEFIQDNYKEMVKSALKMGVSPDKANDIVHDVYMSILKAEKSGEGYDMNKGKESIISVAQFVYGRMKLYSKNKKYRIASTDATEISATSMGEDIDELNSYQKAYAMASSYDEIDAIDDELSVVEEINYILSFEGQLSLSIRGILGNINDLAINVSKIDTSVFNELKEIANSEFVEAFRSIVLYAGKKPERFSQLLASM